jgi:hypothetical protein
VKNLASHDRWNIQQPRSAWIASLPPTIFGLGSAVGLLSSNLAVTLLAWGFSALLILGGWLLVLVRRLPEWGYTWLGSALMILAVFLNVLAEELAETGKFIISPPGDLLLLILILLAGLAALLAGARYGWQPAGLVSIGFASIFGLYILALLNSAPFNRQDLALLTFPGGLVFSAAIYFYTHAKDPARLILLALIWCVNASIFSLAYFIWQPWLAERGRATPILQLLVLSTGFIISGPVLGLFKKPLGRIFGRE